MINDFILCSNIEREEIFQENNFIHHCNFLIFPQRKREKIRRIVLIISHWMPEARKQMKMKMNEKKISFPPFFPFALMKKTVFLIFPKQREGKWHTRSSAKDEKTFCTKLIITRAWKILMKNLLFLWCVCVNVCMCCNFHPLYARQQQLPHRTRHNQKQSSLSFYPLCFLQFPPIII